MINIQQPRRLRRNQPAQGSLPFNKRQAAQVPAIEPDAIERIEVRIGAAVQQRLELGVAGGVQGHDLAVQDDFVGANGGGNGRGQGWEALESVTIARNEAAAAAGPDVGDCAEPIPLQFEQPIGVVERCGETGRGGWG